MYVPAGVPGGTVASPVTGSMSKYGVISVTSVIFTSVPGVNGLPSNVSLSVTSGTTVPPVVPSTGVPVSSTASTIFTLSSTTVTVTSAVSQFVGLRFSQIV